MSKKIIYLDDAIDALKRLQKDISGDYTNLDPMVMAGCGYIGDCIGEIQDLPPAQAERPKGKWNTYCHGDIDFSHSCNQCGYSAPYQMIGGEFFQKKWNFCPNCGADMRGEQDE